jgi:hypothetical protein
LAPDCFQQGKLCSLLAITVPPSRFLSKPTAAYLNTHFPYPQWINHHLESKPSILPVSQAVECFRIISKSVSFFNPSTTLYSTLVIQVTSSSGYRQHQDRPCFAAVGRASRPIQSSLPI